MYNIIIGKQGDGIYLFQTFDELCDIVEGHNSERLIVSFHDFSLNNS